VKQKKEKKKGKKGTGNSAVTKLLKGIKKKKEKEKDKKGKKRETDNSEVTKLLEEIKKEKKKARITYSVGISLIVVALFSFLIFSPLKVPVFSQIGDRILGREVIEEEREEEEVVKEEEPEEEPEEEEEVVEEEVEEETPPPASTSQTTAPPPASTSQTTAPPPEENNFVALQGCYDECHETYENKIYVTNCQPHFDSIIQECDNLYNSALDELFSLWLGYGEQCAMDYLAQYPPNTEGYSICMSNNEKVYDSLVAEQDASRENCHGLAYTRWDECVALAQDWYGTCIQICDAEN